MINGHLYFSCIFRVFFLDLILEKRNSKLYLFNDIWANTLASESLALKKMHLLIWIKACTRPAQIQPDKISVLRRGGVHKVPPPTKKLSATDTCWKKGNQVFSNGLTLGRSTELLGRPHAQHKWDPRVLFCFCFRLCARAPVCMHTLFWFCTFCLLRGFLLCLFLRGEVEMTRIGRGREDLWGRGREERTGSKYMKNEKC